MFSIVYNRRIYQLIRKSYCFRRTSMTDKKVELLRDIYCRGELLHNVQLKNVYPDSKTFVDKKMKFDPEQILSNFQTLKATQPHLETGDLELFMIQNFEAEHGFEEYTPPDWIPKPNFIGNIRDPHLKQFALEVHELWRTLGRRINEDVRANENRYSLLYTPEPFIIPGGRFREFYYWDSYWILRGLVLSEMYETCRCMIQNYLYLVEHFGIIPNGGRIYYADRSQPPVLSRMMEVYVNATNDVEFLFNSIPLLEKEFHFWRENRMVTFKVKGKDVTMFHYGSSSTTPRPESYREDYEWAQKLPEPERPEFYRQVRAAAESGIDFSGRWWVPPYKLNDSFTHIKTMAIIPVDLNSIMQKNAQILSNFFKLIGVRFKSAYYKRLADLYKKNIHHVLWHEDIGCWLDYDWTNSKRREKFYPSNITPLWCHCYPDDNDIPNKVVNYMVKNINIYKYDGGIPASTEYSGQQWDFPNAWAPQQEQVISGLDDTNSKAAKELARVLARNWIAHNYLAYKQDHVMYEKYSAYMTNTGGGGGEYENQVGFGWTNGVLLDLLNRFQDFTFPE